MKKLILAGVISATCLFSNSFAEEDIPKWKQKQLERKAARDEANGVNANLPVGRVGLGFDGLLDENQTAGFSLSFMPSEDIKIQGIIGTYAATKLKDADALSTILIGARGLFVLKRMEAAELSFGMGIDYKSIETSITPTTSSTNSDIMFEFPLRFEYYITGRFSASLTGGILWYPTFMEENNQALFQTSFNALGGAGVHFWM